MTRALPLEDFTSSAGAPAPEPAPAPSAMPEDATLAAYEDGYRCGWDDCARAEAEANRRIGADLAANLAAMTLTHAEARQDVLAAIGPLFEDIAAQLLPRLAAEAVAPTVIAELRQIAGENTALRPLLVAAPASLPALERLLATTGEIELDLAAEPTFAEGQVSIRHAGQRRDMDLSGAADRMAEAIRGFLAQETAEARRLRPAMPRVSDAASTLPVSPPELPTRLKEGNA